MESSRKKRLTCRANSAPQADRGCFSDPLVTSLALRHFRFAVVNFAFYNGLCAIERDGSGCTESVEQLATGIENLQVNGAPRWVGELDAAPFNIAPGVTCVAHRWASWEKLVCTWKSPNRICVSAASRRATPRSRAADRCASVEASRA